MTATIHAHPRMTGREIRRLKIDYGIKVFGFYKEKKNVPDHKAAAFFTARTEAQPEPAQAAQPAARGQGGNAGGRFSIPLSDAGSGEEMNLYRFEELERAHKILELAELKAQRDEHFEAAALVFQARDILFKQEQQALPARPAVAGASNTGSCSASHLPA